MVSKQIRLHFLHRQTDRPTFLLKIKNQKNNIVYLIQYKSIIQGWVELGKAQPDLLSFWWDGRMGCKYFFYVVSHLKGLCHENMREHI